ncbi:hypothetical protein KVD92_01175 [Helicobacter pylori]|nr:hypothetical protein KVD92_01175 [Helicobacter pylori]
MGLKNKIKGFIDHQESVFLAIASLNNESFIERNKSIYKNSSLNYNYGGGAFRR